MSKRAELVDLTVVIHHETDAAVLVSESGDESDAVWLPKSRIEIDRTKGDKAEVQIPQWLAEAKGLA